MDADLEPEKPSVSIWFGVALVVQAATGFFYLAAGLLVPEGVPLVILWCLWGALTFTLIRFRHRGRMTLLVPAATVALWFGYISAGAAVFGWTA